MTHDRAYYRLTSRGPPAAFLHPVVRMHVGEERLVYVDQIPAVRPRVMSADLLVQRGKALDDLREGATLWVPGLERLGYSSSDIRKVIDLLLSTGRKIGDAVSDIVYAADTPPIEIGIAVEKAETVLRRERFGRVREEQERKGSKPGRRPKLSIEDQRKAVAELVNRDPTKVSASEVADKWGVKRNTLYRLARQMGHASE
jgi:DNA invertase Pin-like site-specific DNA recombinase